MAPAYPYPPDPSSRPAIRIQARRLGARVLASAWRVRKDDRQSADNRILLIRPDHLGDLLFLGPALRWLRAETDAHITLAIGPWGQPALPALNGCYDELLVIPFPGFERGSRAGLTRRWSLLPQTARQLHAQTYDTAILFRPDHWWGAMLASFAGIPKRLGYDTAETLPWLTDALILPHEHAAVSNLRLISAILDKTPSADPRDHPLNFEVRIEDKRDAAALLAAHDITRDQPLVIIHPGAGAAVKLWDSRKWGEVAHSLAETGHSVVLTGGPGEEALAAEVAHTTRGAVTDLAGQTTFGLLAALLSIADLVIGPDSGPLNLAVAVGTPTIHLFGPADPLLFGPWGDPHRHVVLRSNWTCIPCGRFDWPDLPEHGCVLDIKVSQVIDACQQMLANQLT